MTLFQSWQHYLGPNRRRYRPNYLILAIALTLVALGALIQFTISPALVVRQSEGAILGGHNAFFYRHLLAIIVGLVGLIFAFKIDLKVWLRWTPVLFLGGVGLSIIAGLSQTRWLSSGWFSIQPSEIVKVFLILLVAGFLIKARNKPSDGVILGLRKNFLTLSALAAICFIVGFMQRDLGSMIVILSTIGAMLLVSGISWRLICLLATGCLSLITYLIFESSYRLARVTTFLGGRESDCFDQAYFDQGYHICQALIGVSTGGFFGRGWGRSIQAYGYLPEINNDSIFAIYAEISGFFGTIILIGLLMGLFYLIFRQIQRLDSGLALISIGILTWLATQSLINIGSMLDLLPMKGITLPYISFGGSSLIMVLFGTGIILQASAYSRGKNERAKINQSLLSRGWIWWARYANRRSGKKY